MKRASMRGVMPFIPFDRTSGTALYTQIYAAFREAILTGRLAPGAQLPSTRALAAELQISRIPVLNAFEQLTSEGYLEARRGSGTYVADPIPDEETTPIRWLNPTFNAQAAARSDDRTSPKLDYVVGPFAVGLPAVEGFPREVFGRLTRRHAATLVADLARYGDPAGYFPLREAIAEYLGAARAVRCEPSQVLIVSGSMMALRISAMTLTNSESVVCVEEPCYPGLNDALRASAATLSPVIVDDEGIDVAAINRLGNAVRMVHVTPSPQHPLGISMSIPRRLALVDWARRNDGWILEDDYDSAFRYGRRPLGSLQGMDSDGRVIYVGSFSKVLFPALRLGYVVVPPHLIADFVRSRSSIDMSSPLLYQLVLADFITEGHFGRHLRRMRTLYQARHSSLIQAIRDLAPDLLTLAPSEGGLHVVAFLPPGVDDEEVVRRAKLIGLSPGALSACYATTASRSGLLLGFSTFDEQTLREAVAELARIIRGMLD